MNHVQPHKYEHRLFSPIRFRQQRDRMNSAEIQAFLFRAVDDLKQAAGVAGGDDFRFRLADVLYFAFEEFVRHFRLREIVNARAATAPT